MATALSNQCLMCGERLNHHLTVGHLLSFKAVTFPVICQKCEGNFNLLGQSANDCQGCGRQLDDQSEDSYLHPQKVDNKQYCYDCIRWLKTTPNNILNHRAMFDYNESLKEWIVKYKYEGDIRMGQVLAPFLKSVYQDYKSYQWVVLPSSPENLALRRFHPTGHLLDASNIPYQCVHTYVGDGVNQAHKSRQERIEMKKTFIIDESIKQLPHKKWLVFDDIYTTGATINHAKELLYEYFKEKGIEVDLVSLSVARDQLM